MSACASQKKRQQGPAKARHGVVKGYECPRKGAMPWEAGYAVCSLEVASLLVFRSMDTPGSKTKIRGIASQLFPLLFCKTGIVVMLVHYLSLKLIKAVCHYCDRSGYTV